MDETDRELSREELLNRYKKQAAPPTDVTARRSPFKFLDSYDVADSDIFFGRDGEIEELLRHYHSLGHVLIYGESGSGKTSLVQCGLRARIPEADALFIPMRIRAEGLPGVCRDICDYASQKLGETVEYSPEMSLIDALLEAREAASRPVVLFFDQFEELLIFHDTDNRRQFAEELAKIPKAKINVKVIIGIRQDFLAQLTELEDVLEGLFDNRFWLRRMSRENAAQAVVKACATCDVKIDETLADSIIQRLDTTGQGIELPYLQVVMDRLYRQAVDTDPDQPIISADDVEKLGDVAQILGNFLADEVEKLASPDQGRQILKAFVSREGTRRTLTREVVAQDAGGFGGAIAHAELDAILSQLVKVRILRENVEAGVCELRHDTLAATVFSWISEVEKELIEVRDNLVNRYIEYQARNRPKSALLDQGFMDYVSVYKHRLKPLLDQPQREYLTSSERELSRRKRVKQLSIFGGILAVILVAFLFVAGILWTRMKAAERIAEAERQKFEEARKTVDQFFVTVSEATLLNQPGMQDLRVTLLSDAGDFFNGYLADFAKEVGDAPDDNLLADVARTNFYLGQLAESMEGEEASLPLYADAQKTQADLRLRLPADEKLLYELGNTLNAMGRAYDNSKQPEKAMEAYKEALKKRKELAKKFPITSELDNDVEKLVNAAEYQRKYASTLMNIGLVEREIGLETNDLAVCEAAITKIENAQDKRLQTVKALEALENAKPQGAEIARTRIEDRLFKNQRDLAMGYWNLAKLKEDMSLKLRNQDGKTYYKGYNDAVDHYNKALTWCRAAVDLMPNDLELRYVLGECNRGLGSVYKSDPDAPKDYQMYQARYQTQQAHLEMAKENFEELAYFSPKVTKYHAAVARAEMFLGNVYKNWIRRQLAEAERQKAEGKTEEVLQYEDEARQKRDQACESLEKALNIFEQYKDKNPDLRADWETANQLLESLRSEKSE